MNTREEVDKLNNELDKMQHEVRGKINSEQNVNEIF